MAEADLEISESAMEHRYDYAPEYLAEILRSVKTIAMVGASGDKTKFSYGVLRQLFEIGYVILPVIPNPKTTKIRGLKVCRSLEEIDRPVDMVDVFRPKEELSASLNKRSRSAPRFSGGRSACTTTRPQPWQKPPGYRSLWTAAPRLSCSDLSGNRVSTSSSTCQKSQELRVPRRLQGIHDDERRIASTNR